jgi:predicted amidohydrolase YtcJ
MAIVIEGGRIAAVLPDHQLAHMAGRTGEAVDLAGRRVVPGLIDSHAHVTRAGTTWNREVCWAELPSLADALERLTARARGAAAGSWIAVVGGWHPGQFREQRGPSRDELNRACPEHPCYVQLLYDEAVLNDRGIAEAQLDRLSARSRAAVERDRMGDPTGVVRGMPAFAHIAGVIGAPSPSQQRRSLQSFIAHLAGYGITGAIDPGGFGFGMDGYEPAFALWRGGELGMRLRLLVCATRPGEEVDEIDELTSSIAPGSGDELLRVSGVGELVVHGCHDMEGLAPHHIDRESRDRLLRVSRLVAERGWPMHVHTILDGSIGAVLDAWEQIGRSRPVGPLGFTLAHVEAIGRRNLMRACALGLRMAVQNRLLLRAADSAGAWGAGVVRNAPPLGRLVELGFEIGAGTDGTRVTPINPWRSLWWLVTGRALDGGPRRAPAHRLDRALALQLYTRGSAALSGESASRGSIAVGQTADLCVLDRDYFAIPDDEIPCIRSALTLLAGRATHAEEELELPGPEGQSCDA